MSIEVLSEKFATTLHAHSADTVAKLFYVINAKVFMALHSKLANVANVFVYEASMVRVPKVTGQAWSPGVAIYYAAGTSNFTTTSAGNTLAGIVNEAALSADAEGIIHLSPF
jgi:predicted RecA/RadA family phage recombinase